MIGAFTLNPTKPLTASKSWSTGSGHQNQTSYCKATSGTPCARPKATTPTASSSLRPTGSQPGPCASAILSKIQIVRFQKKLSFRGGIINTPQFFVGTFFFFKAHTNNDYRPCGAFIEGGGAFR